MSEELGERKNMSKMYCMKNKIKIFSCKRANSDLQWQQNVKKSNFYQSLNI